MCYLSLLVPTVTVNASPTLTTGDSGDAIELLCTVAVMENIIEDFYQFAWTKDGNSIDASNNRIQVLFIMYIVCSPLEDKNWPHKVFMVPLHACNFIHMCISKLPQSLFILAD